MGIIKTIKTKNKEDALKYAYAFMQSTELNIKECSFVNPNPVKFDTDHVFPDDMICASYEETVPSWAVFKSNPKHLASPSFTCVASLDKEDQKRVVLAMIDGNIFFNCYGNYEEDAKKAISDIVSIHSSI